MKIIKFATWGSMDDFISGNPADLEVSEGWGGDVARLDRSAQAADKNLAATDAQTAGKLGAGADTEHNALSPFYENEMNAQHLFSPEGTGELLTAAEAGSGGALGSFKGEGELQAARTRNPSGFTKSMQEMARDKMKADAAASEGIAAQDVMGAQQLHQQGAAGMQGLYGTDISGQLNAMGQQQGAINAGVEAGKSGWLQNLNSTISTLGGVAAEAYGAKKH